MTPTRLHKAPGRPERVDGVDHGIGLQIAIRDARRGAGAALWPHVLATGDWEAMGLAHDVDHLLRAAERKAHALTGRLDAHLCADGIAGLNHGHAA